MYNLQCPCIRGIMPNNSSILCDCHQANSQDDIHQQPSESTSSSCSSSCSDSQQCSQKLNSPDATAVNAWWWCARLPHPDQHPFSPSAATNNDRTAHCRSRCHCCCHHHLRPNQINCNSSNCCNRSNCCPTFSTPRQRLRQQKHNMRLTTAHVTATVSKLSSSPASWTSLKSVISRIILLIALLPSFTLAGGELIS